MATPGYVAWMVKRTTKRPLLDGTAWLLALWVLALAIGVGAGMLTIGETTDPAGTAEAAQQARNFMVGAGPFWIVSGVALVASFVLDDLTVQFRSSGAPANTSGE